VKPKRRVRVSPACERPCAACVSCHPNGRSASLDEVRALADAPELVLGGGDATRWPHLDTLLRENAERPAPQRLFVEAPASVLTEHVLASLAARGAAGVVVGIEGAGDAMLRALGAGDGERVVRDAEGLGLSAEARLTARPRTFAALVGVAARLAPRPVWLELVRDDKPLWPASIERALAPLGSFGFSSARGRDLHLPPCALPALYRARPEAFRGTLSVQPEATQTQNGTFEACARCALGELCRFGDREAIPEPLREALEPPREPPPWTRRHPSGEPVPAHIVKRRRSPEVICTTPWTTMEIVDPDGRVRQCCSTWTVGDRGSVLGASLEAVWNGPGYREARRRMAARELEALCHPICSRLHDERFAERELTIQPGSQRFVDNQLVLAEDVAERRELVRGKPLRLALCPSTYCNYDCIMCDHGRSPRRELPASIWDELPELLPTLQSLTLLGGEPLASPHVMKLLRDFDVARYPDASIDLVTNGSLLTRGALARMRRCTLGDVTVSLNAGNADVYARVQRGLPWETVLANVDALLEFRRTHHRWFGVTLSFVLQPANVDTLLDFAELARARDVRIRLMALNPENFVELDFYEDDEAVSRVVRRVDELVAYCERRAPSWVGEAKAGRAAVLGEAASRRRARPAVREVDATVRRLPVV
jgi:MoaA/NifB/PqqE/SkfB family radical SAM enzyme